ncbi:hypothetical protein [Aquabacterium sp. OR-4]|uniref:hypothetical protein n=1 Tax=Aquabacterium sp. OR-4 TaxID=2978127 RepID=UPI0021B3C0E0|nr:hypothetical protein [Aquabacterium sp. OR-4]MDT7834764.1 hypothetical protein [Aquabacterium sp. OR-4]
MADTVLTGRAAWVDTLRSTLCQLGHGHAGAAGAANPSGQAGGGVAVRPVLLWSRDFAEWPLGEPAVLDSLGRWLRAPGRRLVFIGHDYAATARIFPRLERWRRDWAHRIDAWSPTLPVEDEAPSLLLAGPVGLQLLDGTHWRSRVVRQAALLRAQWEQTDACLQRCAPAWPVTTLGL